MELAYQCIKRLKTETQTTDLLSGLTPIFDQSYDVMMRISLHRLNRVRQFVMITMSVHIISLGQTIPYQITTNVHTSVNVWPNMHVAKMRTASVIYVDPFLYVFEVCDVDANV